MQPHPTSANSSRSSQGDPALSGTGAGARPATGGNPARQPGWEAGGLRSWGAQALCYCCGWHHCPSGREHVRCVRAACVTWEGHQVLHSFISPLTSSQSIRLHLLFRSFSLLPSCAHVLVGNPLSPTGTPRAGGCWGQGRELRLEWGSCSPEAAESDAPEKMPSRVRTGLHPEPTAQPHQVSAWCLACG